MSSRLRGDAAVGYAALRALDAAWASVCAVKHFVAPPVSKGSNAFEGLECFCTGFEGFEVPACDLGRSRPSRRLKETSCARRRTRRDRAARSHRAGCNRCARADGRGGAGSTRTCARRGSARLSCAQHKDKELSCAPGRRQSGSAVARAAHAGSWRGVEVARQLTGCGSGGSGGG